MLTSTGFSTVAAMYYAGALQTDGKLVVAGGVNGWTTIVSDYAVTRYNTDGTLDGSFNQVGKLWWSISTSEYARGIAIMQTNAKIVVNGVAYSGGPNQMAVGVVNPNGTMDTSFNTNGIYISAAAIARGYGVVTQTDGKIVAGGFGNLDFYLFRLRGNGRLDTAFKTTGEVTTNIGSSARGFAIALQTDGEVVAFGNSNGLADFGVVRYQTDGNLDTAFNTTGIVTTEMGGAVSDAIYGGAIQMDGKILAVGNMGSTPTDTAIARYNTNGSLDTSFKTSGKFTINLGSGDLAYGVALQSNGKFVISGWIGAPLPNADFAVSRFNTNGTLDTSFKTSGTFTQGFSTFDIAYGGLPPARLRELVYLI